MSEKSAKVGENNLNCEDLALMLDACPVMTDESSRLEGCLFSVYFGQPSVGHVLEVTVGEVFFFLHSPAGLD